MSSHWCQRWAQCHDRYNRKIESLDFELLLRRTVKHAGMLSLDMSVQTIPSTKMPIVRTVRALHHSQSEMSRCDMLRETGDKKIVPTTSPTTLHGPISRFQIDSVP
jgi:hypothetical protein